VSLPDQVVDYLQKHGQVTDEAGMAATVLRQAVGFEGPSSQFSNLLLRLEQTGVVSRKVRGRRTYHIELLPNGLEARSAAKTRKPERRDAKRAESASARGVNGHVGLLVPSTPTREVAGGPLPATAAAPGRDDVARSRALAGPASGAGGSSVPLRPAVEPAELAAALRVAAEIVDGLAERLAESRLEATAASRRRIAQLDRRVGELERELARARAERDEAAGQLGELQARFEVAQRNLELLAERAPRASRSGRAGAGGDGRSSRDPRDGAAALDRLLRLEADTERRSRSY